MTLDKLLRNVVLVSGLSLFGYNCASTSPEPTSCVKDTDCKGERVCVSGVCQQQSTYGGDATGSGKYTCETYCNNLVECCKLYGMDGGPAKCIEDVGDHKGLQGCIDKCEYVSSQYNYDIKCWVDNQMKSKCDKSVLQSICGEATKK